MITKFIVLEENQTDAKIDELYNHLPENSTIHKIMFLSGTKTVLLWQERNSAKFIEMKRIILNELAKTFKSKSKTDSYLKDLACTVLQRENDLPSDALTYYYLNKVFLQKDARCIDPKSTK